MDGLGSARQLTDASEAVVATYDFDAFGNLIAQSGAATNPYQFAATSGYRNDGDVGLLKVGVRYYDPAVGRFTTADPLLGNSYDPQSLNRYVYVQNNPTNLVDPTGMGFWVVFFVIVAVVVIVIIGLHVAAGAINLGG